MFKRTLLIGCAVALSLAAAPSIADVVRDVACRMPSDAEGTLGPVRPICERVNPHGPDAANRDYVLRAKALGDGGAGPKIYKAFAFPCVMGLPPLTVGGPMRPYCSLSSRVYVYSNGAIMGHCSCKPDSDTCKPVDTASSDPAINCRYAAGE